MSKLSTVLIISGSVIFGFIIGFYAGAAYVTDSRYSPFANLANWFFAIFLFPFLTLFFGVLAAFEVEWLWNRRERHREKFNEQKEEETSE